MILPAFLENILAGFALFPLGVFALISVVIVYILYMLKRRTKTKRLPSMIFLMQQKKKTQLSKWMPRIPINWLLLLHVLLALALSLAILNPFILQPESETKNHVIHVIDQSASMSTANRFVDAVALAEQNIGETNTIIAISGQPTILLEKGAASAAKNIFKGLQPLDSSTAIVHGLSLVRDLQPENAAIHVYSDFIDTTNAKDSLSSFMEQLKSNNNVVVPHVIRGGTNNIGIVDATITKDNITLLVRNYNDKVEEVGVKIGSSSTGVTLNAHDVATLSFPTPDASTTAKLIVNDDFKNDNTFYFSSPPATEFPVLYVSNHPNQFTLTMLSVIDFLQTQQHTPPQDIDGDQFGAFVIEEVDLDKFLPSTSKRAFDKVQNGGILIVKMSDRMQNIQIPDEFPVTQIQDKKTQRIQFVQSEFTEGLTAASEEEVFPAQIVDGARVLISTIENEPVVVSKQFGQGLVVYYGIDDGASKAQFKNTFAFPILFKRLFAQALQVPSLTDINRLTDDLYLGQGNIITPSEKKKQLPALLSQRGFYSLGDVKIAANILNQVESDINPQIDLSSDVVQNTFIQERKVPVGLQRLFLFIALGLVVLEVLYLKRRGDF